MLSIFCSILNVEYASKKRFKNEGLYICSHSYEHIDLFFIIHKLIEENKKATIIVADKWWNHLLYNISSLDYYGIDFVYVNQNKKNKTVKKMIKMIKNKQLVVIFLYKNSLHKGIHYLLNESNIKPILCKVQNKYVKTENMDKTEIFLNTINKTYEIIYEKDYVYSTIDKLKDDLYNYS
jgi:hypothetical protein